VVVECGQYVALADAMTVRAVKSRLKSAGRWHIA